MAAEPDTDPAAPAGPHGGGKARGLRGHSTEILVVCGVATVILGYLTMRGRGSQQQPAQVSPTGVSAGDVAGFDQASVQGLTDLVNQTRQAQLDSYNGLQAAIAGQQQSISSLSGAVNGLPQAVQNALPTSIGGNRYYAYQAKQGDTLAGIASQFGVTPQGGATSGADFLYGFGNNAETLGNNINNPIQNGMTIQVPTPTGAWYQTNTGRPW